MAMTRALTSQVQHVQPSGITRELDDKLIEELPSIVDFGAVPGGVVDNTTAIQTAINTLAARGGGRLVVPTGIFLSGTLTLASNVTLIGLGFSSQLLFNYGSLVYFLYVLNASNVTIENLTINTNLAAHTDGIGVSAIYHAGVASAADNLTVRNVQFTGGTIRPYIDCRSSFASRGVTIEGCKFVGRSILTSNPPAPNSQTTQAIRFLTVLGSGDWKILNNTSKWCGNFLQIRHASVQALDQFSSLVVSGNHITSVLDDPNVSTSPYEIFCVTGVAVTGNTIYSGGRGFNASYSKSVVFSGNAVYDQTRYLLELQACEDVAVVGNTARNCKRLVNDTTESTSPGSKNVLISSNIISGGNAGEPSYDENEFVSAIILRSTVSGYENWTISNNQFLNLRYMDSTIRIDGLSTKQIVIENNFFLESQETVRPRTIMVNKGSDVTIRNNTILRTANISDATLATSSIYAFITTVLNSGGSNIAIDGNTIWWRGTDTRTGGNNTGVIGIGNNEAANVLPGVQVRRNRLVGAFAAPLRLPITTGDTVIQDNDLTAATGANVLNAAVVYIRTKRVVEASAAPSTGTWAVGDRCMNSVPVVGQPKSWVCTVAGTPGTWVSEGNL